MPLHPLAHMSAWSSGTPPTKRSVSRLRPSVPLGLSPTTGVSPSTESVPWRQCRDSSRRCHRPGSTGTELVSTAGPEPVSNLETPSRCLEPWPGSTHNLVRSHPQIPPWNAPPRPLSISSRQAPPTRARPRPPEPPGGPALSAPELNPPTKQCQRQEVLATRIAVVQQQSLRLQGSELQRQAQRVICTEGGEGQEGGAPKGGHRDRGS